ncbi:hypothetical protein SXIM_00050 [Streptomyces xiamenensis]|uniref:Uncharacterized protein n=1 Tax=Streptomyces xiamenensis TaxID=408015 RepID=A0A0F7FNC4_9ACTN|nr:hypothetical protein [Streptomyces xiamenensis]AKG41389.1 hypothetical protein SXIM_00050 [Streptomyces xiamenensis]
MQAALSITGVAVDGFGEACGVMRSWLRDVELTACRVIHADRVPSIREAEGSFRDAWKRV